MDNVVQHPSNEPGHYWVNNLVNVVDELREVHPDMTLNQLQVLLLVAAQPGITQRSIMDRVGLADSSASRIVSILGEHGNRGTGPFKLLKLEEDLHDRRTKNLTLTREGKQLISRIVKALMKGVSK